VRASVEQVSTAGHDDRCRVIAISSIVAAVRPEPIDLLLSASRHSSRPFSPLFCIHHAAHVAIAGPGSPSSLQPCVARFVFIAVCNGNERQ